MALDANINRIKFLRSTVAGRVPTTSLLDDGELAINLADRTIYSKNGANVVELGFGKGGSVSGAITAPGFNGPLTGNATTATTLQTTRTISLAGDATGSTSFNGGSNVSITANVNAVSPLGMYSKGAADLPTSWSTGIQSAFVRSTDGWPMTYMGVINFRPVTSNGGASLQIGTAYGTGSNVGAGKIMLRMGDYSGLNSDAWTSWKELIHSENIGEFAPSLTGAGASGTWNISISGGVSGNASTATTLQTARTINGTSFNGSANITTATWGTSRNLTVGNTAKSVNGSANISWTLAEIGAVNKAGDTMTGELTVPSISTPRIGSTGPIAFLNSGAALGINIGQLLVSNNYGDVSKVPTNGAYIKGDIITDGVLSASSLNINGTITTSGINAIDDRDIKPTDTAKGALSSYFASIAGLTSTTVTPPYCDVLVLNTYRDSSGGNVNALAFDKTSKRILHYAAAIDATTWGTAHELAYTTDNVASATVLQTARTINGTSFNGSANITTANWGTARNLSIGNTAKSVNGSANVSWTLAEIGAVNKAGDTMTGTLETRAPIVATTLADLGTGTTVPIRVPRVDVALNAKGFVPFMHGIVATTSSGYQTNVSLGAYRGSNTWDESGFYAAIGGNDAYPTEAFQFLSGGNIKHTSGQVNLYGNSTTATTLQTARTINGTSFNGSANITTANWGNTRTFTYTGDVFGTLVTNGSANVLSTLTLADIATAGTYKSVTVDAKGRVTAGATVITSLVTATTAAGTSNATTSNTNTYLNIVENVGGSLSSVGSSTQVTGAGTVTVTSDTAGKLTITGAQSITGNAATATALQTARTIGGVSFNGTANINLPGVNIAGNQNTTGNAATATTANTADVATKFTTTGGDAPVFAPRAAVAFNGSTMVAQNMQNIASITDNGTGDYTVNFITPMPDANYTCVVSGCRTLTNTAIDGHRSVWNRTTTGFGIKAQNTESAKANHEYLAAIVIV